MIVAEAMGVGASSVMAATIGLLPRQIWWLLLGTRRMGKEVCSWRVNVDLLFSAS